MNTTKENLPSVSDAEWKVMELLWEQSPQTSNQIVEALSKTDWSPKTIKTLIFRLEKKGLIAHEGEGRPYQYHPLFKKSQYVREESQTLKEKLFGGAVAPLVAHFIKNEKISKAELKEIKDLIASMEEEQ
jgi:BlaI family penicillinase repressor